MFAYERAVRFHEVDPAGLLFYPHFLTYAHEAMERLFDELDAGYAGLILERRIGLPAVAVQSEFSAPLRYGDDVVVETTFAHIGNRSLILRYVFVRKRDSARVAEVRHTVVVTDLSAMRSCPMPDDVRAVALRHREPETKPSP